ncbi:MAG TPA: hypothetical protein VI138_01235 [Candidatus Dormibacteraeota bacterium]
MSEQGSPPPGVARDRRGLPVLRPSSGRGERRFALILGGALLLFIVVQVFHSHPLPRPSHSSASAAVAGYLEGLQHKDVGEVRTYLAPAEKRQAASLLRGLASDHAFVTAPAESFVSQGKRSAQVTIVLQVCAPEKGFHTAVCNPIDHEPLGLPNQLDCVKVGGAWYVSTLLKPD